MASAYRQNRVIYAKKFSIFNKLGLVARLKPYPTSFYLATHLKFLIHKNKLKAFQLKSVSQKRK